MIFVFLNSSSYLRFGLFMFILVPWYEFNDFWSLFLLLEIFPCKYPLGSILTSVWRTAFITSLLLLPYCFFRHTVLTSHSIFSWSSSTPSYLQSLFSCPTPLLLSFLSLIPLLPDYIWHFTEEEVLREGLEGPSHFLVSYTYFRLRNLRVWGPDLRPRR